MIGENNLTQEELRERLIERLKREKQIWISFVTGINKDILSKFKWAKINLYPHLLEKLETYLMNNQSEGIDYGSENSNIFYKCKIKVIIVLLLRGCFLL